MLPRHHIFGIGLRKTGTRSLAAATRALGFRTMHKGGAPSSEPVERAAAAGLPLLHLLGDTYDAYFDIEPLVHRFAAVDEQYPGSRFILSTRDLDAWLDSMERHVRANQLRHGQGRYRGSLLAVEPDRWIEEREAHHAAVRAHFAGRPGALLEIDVCQGQQGWEALAPYLGRPIPPRSFPWENQGGLGTYRRAAPLGAVHRRAVGLGQRLRQQVH